MLLCAWFRFATVFAATGWAMQRLGAPFWFAFLGALGCGLAAFGSGLALVRRERG